MNLDEIVSVQVSLQSTGVRRSGFGLGMLLSTGTPSPAWGPTEKIRRYSSAAAVAAQWGDTGLEAAAAGAYFGQTPCPRYLFIGKQANKPTQKWTITPVAANLTPYTFEWNGVEYTFTSDADATPTEIVTGLKALFNAIPSVNFTATGTTTMIVTANAAGNWGQLSVADPTLLQLMQDHADPAGGVQADLTAIFAVNKDWYTVLHGFNSEAMVLEIDEWVTANKRTFLYSTADADALAGTSGNVGLELKALSTTRTMGLWYPKNGEMAEAAWAGRCLSVPPGGGIWAFRTLEGIPVTDISAYQANLETANLSFYTETAGVNHTYPAKAGGGRFFDITRNLDWDTARRQERVFARLASVEVVPMSNEGIQLIVAEMRAQNTEGLKAGVINPDFPIDVTFPDVTEISEQDRADRILPDIEYSYTIAGAVQNVQIRGVVSV